MYGRAHIIWELTKTCFLFTIIVLRMQFPMPLSFFSFLPQDPFQVFLSLPHPSLSLCLAPEGYMQDHTIKAIKPLLY